MHHNGHDLQLSELLALRSSARKLSFYHRNKANATQSGNYRSHFRGRGMDFDEVRLYQPGDDIRHLDWRVTARRQVPHTKIFREERERPIYLLVDFRSTMYFGTRVAFKSVIAAKIAALLSWVAVETGDKVGAILVTPQKPIILRPEARHRGALVLLQALTTRSAQRPDYYESNTLALLESFELLHQIVRPNGMVFVISDFYGINASDLNTLQSIAKKQQLISLMIYDSLEENLPTQGLLAFANQDSRLSLQCSLPMNQQYHHQFQERIKSFSRWHHNNAAQWACVRTDDNLDTVVGRILSKNFRSTVSKSQRTV